MALIEKAEGREDGGYTRLFGVKALGHLVSRIQATVISSGTELENLIWERCPHKIGDLDGFIEKTLHEKREGIWIARKKQIKDSKRINSQYEPDFLGFNLMQKLCYVIEIKDGDAFDTKKSAGEHQMLRNFINDISSALPFSFQMYLCSFNSASKKDIHIGLKGKFAMEEIMTGAELCLLFGINYDDIIKIRTSDQQKNLEYFVATLLRIDLIRIMIQKTLQAMQKIIKS